MSPAEMAAAIAARELLPPDKGDKGDPGEMPVADFVDPETATPADIINALIAAGLMASS